ncbi:cation:proton antiporter [Cytophaga hutchinsonii]|uniref:Sodium/proton antiporter, CPA1 family n=1 Tax=Cytophaga hutchinsonii (strain ATCC 33406 / DSM 1761 / CIP 103989 / NBRC 15051 / NCIMB 9469 / D465) TaxID=269798 RepID=A0A6N4SRN1_CYTH3|nr:sodium:proton antiporter [Cytophaga hutchinsonii]ABG59050.1 sodium/proton antiporter, CPA1 family [Cytophaga hutchinsonii ATCC 33406]SFX38126.1 sodium/proton antiporter, CPA1 family [Cytophaga hutchinsonii ATCC 33406]
MDILTVITVLIIISALFSYINERFFKMPAMIGVMTISVMVSLAVLIIGKIGDERFNVITRLAYNIDFSKVLLDVMLGFLLFAAALQLDNKKLNVLKRPVFILSTLGVLVSAGTFGAMFYGLSLLLNIHIPLIYCFTFGAIISPTDPIAVGSILKKTKIPARLETIISGESLFNDALGLILFVTLLGVAKQTGPDISFTETLQVFVKEVLGGILLGLTFGVVGYQLIKPIRDYQTIFLISVAVVLGISLVGSRLHASIPLAAVVAGLMIGNDKFSKEHEGSEFFNSIWHLMDEVLNTILFVMIGLQLLVLPFLADYWLIGACSIIIILLARMMSVTLNAFFELRRINLTSLSILTWAGLRGGISIALALSLPNSAYKEIILSCCYCIVIFSVLVQGLTLNKVVNTVVGPKEENEHL